MVSAQKIISPAHGLSTVHSHPSPNTPSPHENTTPVTLVTLETASLFDLNVSDTSDTPETLETLETLETVEAPGQTPSTTPRNLTKRTQAAMLRLDMAACVRHCFFYPSSFSNSLNNFTFPLLLTSTFAHTSNLRARVRRNDSQRHQRALCSFCTNASPFSRFHHARINSPILTFAPWGLPPLSHSLTH